MDLYPTFLGPQQHPSKVILTRNPDRAKTMTRVLAPKKDPDPGLVKYDTFIHIVASTCPVWPIFAFLVQVAFRPCNKNAVYVIWHFALWTK